MSRYQNIAGSQRVVFWLSFAVVGSLLIQLTSLAQSSVIELPGESTTSNDAESTTSGIANSFSRQMLSAESRLAQPTPAAWQSETTAGNLVDMMNRAGFQVLLDESAADNNLDENGVIRLALHNASIDTNLRFALMAYQCDFLISDSGVIRILSDDAMFDNDNMTRTTYDVSSMARDYESADELEQLVQETLDPDSWEDNGGNGRFVATPTKNGFLLTVTQTWQNQRQVRRLLETTLAIGGGAVPANRSMIATNGASRPVRLPEEYLALRRNRRGMALPGSGTTGGFGGGAGLGGGVF